MWCGVVFDTWVPTSWWNLALPSSGLEGRNSRIMKRGAASSSNLFGSIYQTSWSHIPWIYSQQTEVPITYHIPRFNVHDSQGHRNEHQTPQKICSKFLTSQNTWWCPPSEPVWQLEFIAVVCSGIALTGGSEYKWCQHRLRKLNYSLLKLNECAVLPYIR